MGNTNTLKKFMQAVVFTTPIRLDRTDFCIEKTFDMRLKAMKDIENIGFMLKTEQPSEFAKIIYEAHIVAKTS